jgi:hypothetical protein
MTIFHLENHPHAVLNTDNVVFNVLVFDELAHDSPLLEEVRISTGATQVVCCCTLGVANIGDTWTGEYFKSPMPTVEGFTFTWDESSRKWIANPSLEN